MTFNEIFETLPGNGWLTKSEAELLWRAVTSTEEGPILEVGCYQGRSTVLLAATGRLVYCVDPWMNFGDTDGAATYTLWKRNMEERGIENLMPFRQVLEKWVPRQSDFAYLDGDHSYVGTRFQIETAQKCGVASMCIHDYATEGGGALVKEAIEDSGIEILEIVERMVWCK
jgi:hypothetical protein